MLGEQIMTLKDLERHHLDRVLTLTRGHITRAARILGLSRAGLYSKLRIHGIANVKKLYGKRDENVCGVE